VDSFAMAQQTWPDGQSDFCRHPKDADPIVHVVDLEMHEVCSVSVRQQVFVERAHAVVPQRGTPAELNWTGLGTRAVEPPLDPDPLPDPELLDPLELEIEPELEPDELPELDPLELVDPSLSSSPESGPLLLLLQAGADTETSAAMTQRPRPRSHGRKRGAIRRAVM
jgi:hypothetical protein